MDLETFRRLERVNIEGTLLVLAESARHFRAQAPGGDIVLGAATVILAMGQGRQAAASINALLSGPAAAPAAAG